MPSWWALHPRARSATKGSISLAPDRGVSPLSQFEMVISGVDSHARPLENTDMRSSVVIRKRAI